MKKIIAVAFFVGVVPMLAFAMRDAQPPLYGHPTLYSEYENIKDDASPMATVAGTRKSSIRVIPVGKKAAIAKHPVNAKAAKPKQKSVLKHLARRA